MNEIPLTPRAINVLNRAAAIAKESGLTYIGTEHLFLSLLSDSDGVVPRILKDCGIDQEKFHQQAARISATVK